MIYPIKEMYRIINKLIDYKDELLNLKVDKLKIQQMITQQANNSIRIENNLNNKERDEKFIYDKNERKKLQAMLNENETKICMLYIRF